MSLEPPPLPLSSERQVSSLIHSLDIFPTAVTPPSVNHRQVALVEELDWRSAIVKRSSKPLKNREKSPKMGSFI